MEKELIKLTDGELMKIEYDCDSIAGCPTCDYGSKYINEYNFYFDKNEKLYISVNNMYNYFFSEGDMMCIILANIDHIKTLSKEEFCDWLVDNIENNKQDRSRYTTPDKVYATYYINEQEHKSYND